MQIARVGIDKWLQGVQENLEPLFYLGTVA